MKKILLLSLATLILTVNQSSAQKGVTTILQGSATDAEALMRSYLNPMGNAFGAALNGGWFNTAKSHGLARFDLTFTANFAFIPSSENNFIVPNGNVIKASGTSATSPSISGNSTTVGPTMNVVVQSPLTGNDTTVTTFQMPKGLYFKSVMMPILQLNVGLIKQTELAVRYMPEGNVPGVIDSKTHLWGIGFKHGLTQYIPFGGLAPIDIALQFGYTSMGSALDISVKPDATAIPTSTTDYSGQQLKYNVTAWTANLLVSKKVAMVTFYGGIGYNHSSSNLILAGKYPITTIETSTTSANIGKFKIQDINDPIDLQFNGIKGGRGTLGVRFKLLFFTLHADYTFAQYSVLTAGLGFNLDLK